MRKRRRRKRKKKVSSLLPHPRIPGTVTGIPPAPRLHLVSPALHLDPLSSPSDVVPGVFRVCDAIFLLFSESSFPASCVADPEDIYLRSL